MRKGGAKASPFFFYGMPLSGETFISPIEFGVKAAFYLPRKYPFFIGIK